MIPPEETGPPAVAEAETPAIATGVAGHAIEIKPTDVDTRFMAAAIRLSERHVGVTATNPSVATLIVADDGEGPVIVGRGITAPGGRPHAETIALTEAGERAIGATAYVTLEPCAHHGRTPPCAEALVRAGVARVVSAAGDPDARVNGNGHRILREAGIVVTPGVLAGAARRPMSGYLARVTRKRPEVTLKFAVSADGRIGRPGAGQIFISGDISNRQTHLMRARHDAIMVGVGTVEEDDPALTCRLPGLSARSPLRIVLDARLRTPLHAGVVTTARETPTAIAFVADRALGDPAAYRAAGCELLSCEADPLTGRIALPELLDDMAARGLSSLLVEGGLAVGRSFIEAGLVDRLIIVEGGCRIGEEGVAAPLTPETVPSGFVLERRMRYGQDRWSEYLNTRREA